MPRSHLASLPVLVTIASLPIIGALSGCDAGEETPIGAAGTTSSAGIASVSGASAGGQQTAGSAAQAGSVSTAGMSGTGTGGAAIGGGGAASGSNAGGSGGTSAGGAASGCNGAIFCDDFESYTDAPGAPWKVDKNSAGNVLIDGAQHRSGSKAVKLTTTGAIDYQKAYITFDQMFPLAQNAFYGRMMIYTPQAAKNGVHWTMIQGSGPAAGGITNADVRYGGQHEQRLMANYYSTGKSSDCWQHSATKMPEGKWACLQWYFDGATNTQKLWLDGAALDDMTVVDKGEGCVPDGTEGKWVFPTFSRVSVGWESYHPDDPREVWIDDVAFGLAPLACPQ